MLPKNRPLNDVDIHKFAKEIPFFRGVFMRDEFGKIKCRKIEATVCKSNLAHEEGSHWVAFWKKDNTAYYFDSFGNLPPPEEIVKYLGDKCHIYYNKTQYQTYGTVICGHLCLQFLYTMYNKLKI